MSDAYKCDRCGKFYDAQDEYWVKIANGIYNRTFDNNNELIIRSISIYDRNIDDTRRLDLCALCANELAEWLCDKDSKNRKN